MKNEKDFKKQISEIAAKIANVKEEEEKAPGESGTLRDRLEKIKPSLESALSSINTDQEFAFIITYLQEIMPKLKPDIAAKGATLARQVFNSSEPVSKDSPNAAYPGMDVPDHLKGELEKLKKDDEMNRLKENYERIKKK